jgi:hypothetical protein
MPPRLPARRIRMESDMEGEGVAHEGRDGGLLTLTLRTLHAAKQTGMSSGG